jgi:hypothetical protein
VGIGLKDLAELPAIDPDKAGGSSQPVRAAPELWLPSLPNVPPRAFLHYVRNRAKKTVAPTGHTSRRAVQSVSNDDHRGKENQASSRIAATL